MSVPEPSRTPKPKLLSLLRPYYGLLSLLLLLALLSNALNLVIPKLIQQGIDAFQGGVFRVMPLVWMFAGAALFIFVLQYLQGIVQTYASERVARDLRTRLSAKISGQSYTYIQEVTSAKLLTNLTSDVDAIKMFIAQAIVSIVSSLVLIIGASILLLRINWKLGLLMLLIVPVIAGTFLFVFRRVKVLFKKGQEVVDRLNKVINESILGAALIRVLHAQAIEHNKFMEASREARSLGMSILRLFALLIPVIVFTSNMARLTVLALGGHYVISGSMSLGEFAAFSSYIAILIFPILVIGFMSNVIARASASYARIYATLHAPDPVDEGTVVRELSGAIRVKDVTVQYGEKKALKGISFGIPAGSRTAIIGPTAAGKSQLFYLLTTLTQPTEGTVYYDDVPVKDYREASLLRQIGLVFQDSIIFNMSLRENIAFNAQVGEEALARAIATAELDDFIAGLPQQLDTIVSERGMSLSGGQQQRIMLARALAIGPRILLLDDFTARVDAATEAKILANVRRNYPGITVVSITQKIAAARAFDQIILLMEGELVAAGTHEELMRRCPEYVQIYDSQQSLPQG